MPSYDFRSTRLYVDTPLTQGGEVTLDRTQTNYLLNVLRLGHGDSVLLFNGVDGEWQAILSKSGKRSLTLNVGTQQRAQTRAGDLHFMFAPLKHARLDYLVQKAVEMGASRLQPVMTRHTQVARVNLDRMHANAVEAAEQCGILGVPEIAKPIAFDQVAAEGDRLLVFCDEDAEVRDPVAALVAARVRPHQPLAILIGPEGGFAEEERLALLSLPMVVRIALGPRILRADTAAVAALALVQAILGDWEGSGGK